MKMTTRDFFTYNDLYDDKPKIYRYQDNHKLLSLWRTKLLSIPHTTIASIPTTKTFSKLVSSTTMQSSNKLYQLVQLVPFDYLHWFFIGLAILLALLLIIIFICYCHAYCRNANKSRNETKQPLPNFYRYRKVKGSSTRTNNIYEATVPYTFPSPKRPCPLNPKEYLSNQTLGQDLDITDSPQTIRLNISRTKSPSPCMNIASDLLSEIKTRLSIRSSETSIKTGQSCEIPVKRSSMHLNADSKHDAVLIDMN
ncbi:unnamed protein product [Rotaria magnacalcarata]|uniref:Uncharacterized protein n=2 Tax=Rotaria magnacalcarata TaxID=392030 RepID=A0A816LKW9_9BILA|nr:unnamed protein product [Rotaria magnacalcarata]